MGRVTAAQPATAPRSIAMRQLGLARQRRKAHASSNPCIRIGTCACAVSACMRNIGNAISASDASNP
jgi:hypothetical protein